MTSHLGTYIFWYSSDLETAEFKLEKGDNWIEVVFIGDYAGKNQKYDRLLPEIKISEEI